MKKFRALFVGWWVWLLTLAAPGCIAFPATAAGVSGLSKHDHSSAGKGGTTLSPDLLTLNSTAEVVPTNGGLQRVGNDIVLWIKSGGNFYVKSGATGPAGDLYRITSAGVLTQYNAAAAYVGPPGIVMDFAGSTAPDGWLLCNGAAVSRTTYANLFAAIGTTYGPGDGSTTFNLPDARGRVAVGAGQGTGLTNRALGATGGAETHTLTVAQLAAHDHGGGLTGSAGAHTHTVTLQKAVGTGGGEPGNDILESGTNIVYTTSSDGAHQHAIPVDGSSQPHNIMQPFLVLNRIIKY